LSLSSSCSSSLSGSSSLLDFQSLQSSSKQVRLSQSPGELRLERDLRNLVSNEGWNIKSNNTSICLGEIRAVPWNKHPVIHCV
jgi:hypothetical protein